MNVSQAQVPYIASNEASLREAEECPEMARAFSINAEETMVGFAMFAFDLQYKDRFLSTIRLDFGKLAR